MTPPATLLRAHAAARRLLMVGISPGVTGVTLYRRIHGIAALAAGVLLASPLLLAAAILVHPAFILPLLILPPLPRLIAGLDARLTGYRVSKEIPALLAYLLPYTYTPRHMADLLSSVPRRLLPGSYREAERLRAMLDSGLDPQSALKKLAETTPSKELREIILDYLNVTMLGASRSQTTMLMLQAALERIRRQWNGFMHMSRATTEAMATISIAVAALSPVMMLTGTQPALLAVLLVAPPAAALTLSLSRPSIGEPGSTLHVTATLLVASLAAALVYMGYTLHAVIILAAAAVIGEVAGRRDGERVKKLIAVLKKSADDARYGGDYEESLREAKPLAPALIEGLLTASRKAGKMGVGSTLSSVHRIFYEAWSLSRDMASQAWILAVVIVASMGIASFSIVFLEDAVSTIPGGIYTGIDASAFKSLIHAMAVLAPLPAAVSARPRPPSLIPSLASLLIVLAVSGDLQAMIGTLTP